jgi:1-acyl-sn-glycerol-3-phosphate acyltransferase
MFKEIDRTASLIRRQTRMFGVAAWTWGLVSSANLHEHWVQDRDALNAAYKMRWVRGARQIVGLDLNVVRGEPLPEGDRGRLIISNHRTPLDIIALLSLFGGHFLANHRVSRAPVVGPGAHRIGTIFVDRGDKNSGAAAIQAMRKLLERNRTVIVFPEGTTFEGDEVRPFRRGAFTAAAGLPVEIIPVGLAYTPGHELGERRMGEHVRTFLARNRTPAWISIGEAIPAPENREGLDILLKERVQELVHDSRRAASRALGMPNAGSTAPRSDESSRDEVAPNRV